MFIGDSMFKKIIVKNFRSLKNFSMEFNEGLNVIIGENDAGKTSLIDSLKILFNEKKVDVNDFNNFYEIIEIQVETDDTIFVARISPSENPIITYKIQPSKNKCFEIRSELNSEDFLTQTDDLIRDKLKNYCSIFSVTYRKTSKIETIIKNLMEKIEKVLNENEYIESKNIDYPVSFLGSKEFEDMNNFFENSFFKEFKQKIWDEPIQGKSIYNHLELKIDKFKENVLDKHNTEDLYKNLSDFLPNFKEIKMDIEPDPKLNLNIDVKFLNSKNEQISLEKMGDGTNRRTTMAVFKHKSDKEDLCYVFDEPDAHLHIKAQLDVLHLFEDLTNYNKQVIITTHSPFLINEINPNDIKLMYLDDENISHVKEFTEKIEPKYLADLGINNLDLFFTQKLIIVEGESELIFLPKFYEKVYNEPITHKFVKILKAEGIDEIPRFVQITKEAFSNTNIIILMDNDASKKTENKLKKISNEYDLSKKQIFKLGEKEFEDSFSDEIILQSINDYLKDISNEEEFVTMKEIKEIRKTKKFSGGLAKIIFEKTNESFKKPLFAEYLVKNCTIHDVDAQISKLFDLIR